MMRAERGFVLPIVLIFSAMIGFWTVRLLMQNQHDVLASTHYHAKHQTAAAMQLALLDIVDNKNNPQASWLPTLASWLQHHQPTHDKQQILITACQPSDIDISSLIWQESRQSSLIACRQRGHHQYFWLSIVPISQTQYAHDFANVASHHLSVYLVKQRKNQDFNPACLKLSMFDLVALKCLNEQDLAYQAMAIELLLMQQQNPPSQPSWHFLRIYDVNLIRD